MKIASLILLLLFPLGSMAGETAYQALRAVGAQRNPDLLNRVLEVKGTHGTPQPATWTILLDDPLANGGVREIEVSASRIVSERTPVKAPGSPMAGQGAPMNFHKLNLDSAGAFTMAEEEARGKKIGFNSVDYVLRCDQIGSAPTWMLSLYDAEKHNVGSMTIAADSGTVLKSSFTKVTTKEGYQAFVEGGGLWGAAGRATDSMGRGLNRAGKSMSRTFRKTGATMEEFFTGERTLDQQDRR